MFDYFIYALIFAALIIGSYTDFKKREVPDWLNYALIATGLFIRIIFSVAYGSWAYIVEGALGFGAFFLLAVVMFYAGQWGGGDSKMLMGIGAMLGMPFQFDSILLAFVINTVFFGALFGVGFSVYLVIMNWTRFKKQFVIEYTERKVYKYGAWIMCAMLIITSVFFSNFIRFPLIILSAIVFFTFYLFVYLRAVEKAILLVWVEPETLTEGDWIVEDVFVDKKRVCGPKDLGIEKTQIAELIAAKKKGKIKQVLIKNGFPFVPGFLIAFIVTVVWGNIVLAFI
jgi:Flp pilus assembly protein protease CpaA